MPELTEVMVNHEHCKIRLSYQQEEQTDKTYVFNTLVKNYEYLLLTESLKPRRSSVRLKENGGTGIVLVMVVRTNEIPVVIIRQGWKIFYW